MGCIASAMGVPEINLDAAAVAASAAESTQKIVDDMPYKERDLRNEAHKAGDKGYAIPDSKVVLTEGKSTDDDFKKGSALLAANGEVRDKIKGLSWDAISPNLEKQLPETTPPMIKEKALGAVQKKHDDIVDKAIDDAIAKALADKKKA